MFAQSAGVRSRVRGAFDVSFRAAHRIEPTFTRGESARESMELYHLMGMISDGAQCNLLFFFAVCPLGPHLRRKRVVLPGPQLQGVRVHLQGRLQEGRAGGLREGRSDRRQPLQEQHLSLPLQVLLGVQLGPIL